MTTLLQLGVCYIYIHVTCVSHVCHMYVRYVTYMSDEVFGNYVHAVHTSHIYLKRVTHVKHVTYVKHMSHACQTYVMHVTCKVMQHSAWSRLKKAECLLHARVCMP